MSTTEAIAIVGHGLRFPGGAKTPAQFWDLLHHPRNLAQEIPSARFNVQGYYHENGEFHGHGNVREAYFLEEDAHLFFDAPFFGVSPAEAAVMDPQARLLLETVFEALEDAGITINQLKGSNTAVYAGQMVADYEQVQARDLDSMASYHATGTSRALLSNRISYFFDWHGPSVTIDTACSSSLVAVHQAVQQLRTGQSRVAIVAGVNMILDPHCFAAESTLHMLSPEGRCRMWDASANGYGRGEGIAAVVLKTLSDAESDGDTIECIIRETGVNQDGKTQGITMPNPMAQCQLIRSCYERIGLDLSNPDHRPQFFEAHGTGTPAGDPIEAEAIKSAFFSELDVGVERLYVGSIKTIIGHTEGTAGLAGILKACLALRNAVIPPNLLFEHLNPRIEPFYANLCIPTSPITWPTVRDGSPRRASVNSFGFGGTNAHAILESYPGTRAQSGADGTVFAPFLFSAQSEQSLRSYLVSFLKYLETNGQTVNPVDLAYTLYARRTRHQRCFSVTVLSADELRRKLASVLHIDQADSRPPIGIQLQEKRSSSSSRPSILGIFTGQGAHWAQMGIDLIKHSSAARKIMETLQNRLWQLPSGDAPSWSLLEELEKDVSSSRIAEAHIAQPLCTAIQILQVQLLRAAGVKFTSLVGHSSGEIACAFAAGFISAEDAICIAYYRGFHSKHAGLGAMMAVGTSAEDAQELLVFPEFKGRACLAAVNSPTSVTISGDPDAICELQVIFQDEKKFTRILKIKTAYHSHHILSCSDPYIRSLAELNVEVSQGQQAVWYSSSDGVSDVVDVSKVLSSDYWNDNMIQPVYFMQAVQRACTAEGGFDLVVEVGPHPALKGPCLETLGNAKGEVPYTGLFHRGSSAVQSMAGALGFVMSHLGEGAVHIHRYNELLSGNSSFSLIKNLPTYSWNREKRYWHESRLARAIRMRQQPVHELLGHVTPDSSSCEMRWRGLLRPVDIPWIMGHRLHGQTVFPASGYVVMALEAAIALSQPAACGLIEIFNMDLVRALTFDQDTTAMEIIFSVTNITRGEDVILEADFTCTGALMYGHDELRPLATGKIQVLSTLNEKFPSHLEVRDPLSSSLVEVPKTKFYSALEKIGYNYNGPFAALENMKRKLGAATGAVRVMAISNLIIHPAVLDAVFQSAFLNYAAPGDRRLLSVHVPRRINSVIVDPGLCESIVQDTLLLFDSMMQLGSKTAGITSGVNVYSCEGTNAMIHVQGLHCVPLVQGSTSDDVALFSEVVWDAAAPNIEIIDNTGLMRLRSQNELSAILERMAIVYLRTLQQNVPSDHKAREKGPYQHWFHFASTALSRASAGELPSWQSEWENDTLEEVENALIPYSSIIDVQLLRAVGQNIVDIATGAKLPVEVGIRDGLLARYYSNGYGLSEFTELLARTVRQIVHRSPNMNIVELGGGTGAVTKAVLDAVGDKMSSYTFTDISSTFLDSARQFYHGRDGTMAFQRLDIDQDPRSQGFKEHSYDLVIASLVLHATPSLKQAVRNARLLLKPGGYLVALELKPTQYIHYGVIFGAFPGWWLGTDEGRISSPAVNLSEWNDVLQKSGFSGCDTVSPELKDVMTPVVLFVSQAVDSKVNFLRNPLSTSVRPFLSDSVWHQLIIVGGRDIGTSGLMQEVGSLLNGRFEKVTSFPSFPDLFRSRELSSETTVLSLVDLDQNILENIDQETWDGLRSTLLDLGTLIWVTCGRRRNNPFSSAIIGLVRSTAREITSLDYFFLDFESSTSVNARSIAESVLRYKATKYWNSEGNLTAAPETEMTLNCQSLFLIPRLVPSQPMNDRYNSSRRLITANSDIADLQASRTGMHIVLERVPPPSYFDESSSTMETTHSLVSAIRVSEYSFMFLSLAKDSVTDQRQVVLSSQNASASQPYIGELAVPLSPCPGNESSLLILVAHHIMASLVLEGLSEGDTILIHDAGHDLARVLSLEAASQGVEATFSITRNDKKREGLRVHTFQFHALDLTVSQSLLNKTTVFINCEKAVGNRSLGKLIASSLPAHCKKLDMDYVFMAESCPPRGSKAQAIKERLEQAVLRACDFLADEQRNRDTSSISTTVFPVSDVDKETPLDAIMDWKSKSSAKIKLNPAESLIKFSGKKTFWLVGLTGGLGLSLCEWMIHHGARHVMLSSRNPQVDPSWLAAMNGLGASVRVASCDISRKQDVTSLYSEMVSNMPPIGGVAQGAMILEDVSIRDMTLDALRKVMRPKVEGTIYLNELFSQNTLDFFVVFSSATSINGNPGQSAYSAANLFMAALAEQRRRQGLAASVMHIGPIFGIGYIAQAIDETTIFAESTMRSGGYMATSEYDFHQLFAEAVLAGMPGSHAPFEIVSGFRHADSNSLSPPLWLLSPMMSHFIRNHGSTEQAASSASMISVKAQLATARNPDEVFKIVQSAFYAKAESLFQLDSIETSEMDLSSTSLSRMGIDSLSAVEIRGWFLQTMEVNIPVLKILNNASIGELVGIATDSIIAKTTKSSEQTGREEISKNDGGELAPDPLLTTGFLRNNPSETLLGHASNTFALSFSQEMFWFLWSSLSDKSSLNHTGWARIKGKIRVEDLKHAALSMGIHHQILRARFFKQGNVPVQSIMETSRLKLEHRQIKGEHEVQGAAQVLNAAVLDVEQGDSVRLLLLSVSPTTHFLVFAIHPLVMDGFSFQIFLTQLMGLYSNPHLELPMRQYLEHAEKQHKDFESGLFDQELQFWKAEFSTMPPPLPVLKLSSLNTRPRLSVYENETAVLRITKETRSLIQTVCRRYSVTAFHFYLATFRALLERYTEDSSDIVVGVGDANRTEDDMMDVIGPFINLLPVRLRTRSNTKFEDLLEHARLQTLGALQSSRIPFQVLLSRLGIPRSSTHTPLFQCFIDYRQGQKEFIQWDDIEMQFESFQNLKLGYDVALDIVEDPRGTSVHILKVRKDLYDQAGAEKMIRSYERLVHSYASSPAVLLDDPDMFDPTESNDMIKLSQGPSLSSRWPLTVVHQFVEVSHQQPRSIAVINADNTIISYSTLSLQARTIATALISAGVKSGSHVAVLQEVTHHWVASILGIWHIGAIYVPLDLGLPSYRHVAIVRDSRPSVILVDDSTLAGSVKISGSESIIIDVTKLNDEMGHQAPPIVADGSARCAILYTSGSTGTPKGVILKHIGLRNFSEMTPPLLGVGSEIVLQQTSSVFDLSLIQITTALCHGGCLCLIPWNRRGDAVHISRVMLQHNVTFTCATPSEYCTWIDHGRCQLSQCANWRMAFCIGEPIPKFLPGQMSTVSPNVRLYNLYGPCETSLAATAMEVPLSTDPWHSAIPAGTPLPNYSVYIVDTKLRPVPIGVQGEIYIGGVGVGAGYLNKPALTAEKFVPDIFAKCADTANGAPLLHRTGDLGRWSSEGTLLVERRVAGDKQIKLRGIRIDLGEIEDTIVRAANPAVHQAVVTVSSSLSETDTFLRAHVVFGEAIKEDDMKGWIVAINSSLGNVLPQYMCPAIITPVQSLPRMNSGKIDRQAVAALPLPATIVNRESEDNSDLTDTEKRLSLLWQELLVLESSATSEYNILPQTDFFHIGGTSLRLLNLQARIREVFHVEVSILSMFEHSTLAGIARWIEGSGHESSSLAPDWDADTSLPPDLRDVRQLASINSTEPVKPGKIVVLTGATGAVGKMLLKALQLDEEVEEIHCIAVRDAANRQQICRGGKVTLYQGDLALPNLGLSKEDAQFIFSRASTIVHNGAEVSYLKTYRSLYGANVRSTKELIRLCLPRVVAFHYISSTAVETGEGSDASGRPRGGPLAGLGSGYTMSKQVSEAFLQNLKSRYSGWPIWIHRPSLISDKDRNGGGPNSVIESIQRYSKTLRAIPVMPRDQMGLSGLGIFNVVPMHVVVRGVLDAVMMPEGAEIPDSIQICRHVGNSEINMENLRGWASETGPEVEEEENSETVKEMKVSEWAAKAGELGMDPTIVVFMKAVATDMGLN